MEAESRARRTLYVGGLDEGVTLSLLQAAFIPFGTLTDVQLPLDVVTQKNRGFGFVEFVEEADARAALDNMDNAELLGRVLRVTIAKPQKGKSKAVWDNADDWFASLQKEGDDAAPPAGAVAPTSAAAAGASSSSSSSSSSGGGSSAGAVPSTSGPA